jgi:probable rRNA maturation factor
MTHQISVTGNRRGINPPALRALLRNAVKTALSAEGMDYPCEINILLTDDAGIHEVNLEMRDIDRPTDVLSFPMFDLVPGEHPDEMDADPATGRIPLGDMCISVERARAQAQEYGHSFEREICYLSVHSVLHLLGYDHLDEGEMKRQMRAREEDIMSQLKLER